MTEQNNLNIPRPCIPAAEKTIAKKHFQEAGRVNILFHIIARIILRILGWRVEGMQPQTPKYVAIVAPHTSYWDFPLALFISWHYRLKGAWLGKSEIFSWPVLGWFFRMNGGIALDRSRSQGLVERAAQVFAEREQLVFAVTPEGTRAKCNYWKSGFYHIAVKANVPIALGFLDFRRKCGGFGPLYHPTGDVAVDLDYIRAYYDTITPRHPERRSAVAFRNYTDRETTGSA